MAPTYQPLFLYPILQAEIANRQHAKLETGKMLACFFRPSCAAPCCDPIEQQVGCFYGCEHTRDVSNHLGRQRPLRRPHSGSVILRSTCSSCRHPVNSCFYKPFATSRRRGRSGLCTATAAASPQYQQRDRRAGAAAAVPLHHRTLTGILPTMLRSRVSSSAGDKPHLQTTAKTRGEAALR